MASLQSIYIGCTVFSVGVTLMDFLGILGHHDDHDGGDMDDAGHFDGDTDHGDQADSTDHEATSDADTVETPHGGVAILSVLSYLRSLVYFSLGFGPTGWVAISTGRTTVMSLVWALPAGLVALVLARAFFRFQRSDTDSSLRMEDLLFQRATVTVPISHDKMGKVRVQIGMNVTEQYALATAPNTQFERGDIVWITDVTEECVHVEDDIARKGAGDV